MQNDNVEFTASDLQFLRCSLKGQIKELTNTIGFQQRLAASYWNEANKENPDTLHHFEAHSHFRAQYLRNQKTLRKMEELQRKIRRQLSVPHGQELAFDLEVWFELADKSGL
jgi:hypothetical protein